MTITTGPDTLEAAADAVAIGAAIVDTAARRLAELSAVDGRVSVAKLDEHQVLAYELAHGAAAVEASKVMQIGRAHV